MEKERQVLANKKFLVAYLTEDAHLHINRTQCWEPPGM